MVYAGPSPTPRLRVVLGVDELKFEIWSKPVFRQSILFYVGPYILFLFLDRARADDLNRPRVYR